VILVATVVHIATTIFSNRLRTMLGSLVTAIGVINDDDENEIEGTIDVVVVVV
jgi:hypothetical protein